MFIFGRVSSIHAIHTSESAIGLIIPEVYGVKMNRLGDA